MVKPSILFFAIYVLAVCSREISLIGNKKTFLKEFDLLLFGRTQHIDLYSLYVIFVRIFELRQTFLQMMKPSMLVFCVLISGSMF